MKIKLNKYILFYIILIFISIIFYINFNFFRSFLSDYEDYINISQLKSQDSISYGNYNYHIKLSNIDIANLRLLKKDFSGSKNLLYKTNEYSYKDFYNLGNIYLLQAYNIFSKNKTGTVDLTKKSLAFYETSLENIPSYKNKKPIISNLNISQNFLNFLYVYSCDNLFFKMVEKVNDINKLISSVVEVLKKQESTLDKWLKYNDLKSCINAFRNNDNNNISTLYDTKRFFINVNDGLIVLLKDFQLNEISCYQQSPMIKSKYKDNIYSSYDYYLKYLKKQKDMLKIFEKANKKQMALLCHNRDKIAKNQNKENKKMQNNLNKLRELTQKNEKQEQKKRQQQGKQRIDKQKNKKDNKGHKDNKQIDKKGHKDNKQIDKKYSEKIQSLEKQNKNLIEQIQREKTQNNYNPLKYIQKLFKSFYANDKDFIEGKKQNSVGK